MKRLMTIVALMCAIVFTANAQKTPEEYLKDAKKLAEQADKNPTDGKMQLYASRAFIDVELGDKKDYGRALEYGNRALKIATENPAPKDTLMGLSCLNLTLIYRQKNDTENYINYAEKAIDALEYELGRHDPMTIGFKLINASLMLQVNEFRAMPEILEAFVDNAFTPRNNQITNMDEANVLEETALEMLIARHTERYRYALPLVFYEGKQYYILQTQDWNMEKPLVGWMVPRLLRTPEEQEKFKGDDIILYDGKDFIVIKEDGKINFTYSFNYIEKQRRQLQATPDGARVFFNSPQQYNAILAKFREFKATLK